MRNAGTISYMPAKKLLFPRRNLTGQIFGRLTVIKFYTYKNVGNRRKDYWETRCECGNIKNILGNSLVSGGISSCGCLLKEHYSTLSEKARKRNSLPKGEASFNSILASYKDRAKKKKLKFHLSDEEFREFITSNCQYCDSIPINICNKKKSNGSFTYNGIDRLDNNKGYVKVNCITACEVCNKAKRDLTLEEFITWIQRISRSNNWKKLLKVQN